MLNFADAADGNHSNRSAWSKLTGGVRNREPRNHVYPSAVADDDQEDKMIDRSSGSLF